MSSGSGGGGGRECEGVPMGAHGLACECEDGGG